MVTSLRYMSSGVSKSILSHLYSCGCFSFSFLDVTWTFDEGRHHFLEYQSPHFHANYVIQYHQLQRLLQLHHCYFLFSQFHQNLNHSLSH